MNIDNAIAKIVDYCKEQIVDFDGRAELATSKMCRERIPIENADFSLANEVVECINDWCTDNECESLVDNITTMDIIMNM